MSDLAAEKIRTRLLRRLGFLYSGTSMPSPSSYSHAPAIGGTAPSEEHIQIHKNGVEKMEIKMSYEEIKPSELFEDFRENNIDKTPPSDGTDGAIDVTHIIIDPPRHGKDDYVDRTGDISICLQAICDESAKFLDIFVGYPGSTLDSRVLQNSFIYPKLLSLYEGFYILGDSAYPCSEFLLTPFRDNGHLTREQKKIQ